MPRTPRLSLPRISNRVGVLTVGRARVAKEGHSVVIHQAEKSLVVPTATLSALLLEPGTTLTHAAAGLLADQGVVVVWVGEGAARCYGSVTPLVHRSSLLQQQVTVWADAEMRMAAARRAYSLRFPDDLGTKTSMAALRSMEGARVKQAYREVTASHGLFWAGRCTDWGTADPLNQALTIATQCLYGVATSVILSLGCHPALGFIHTGHPTALTFDLADLFKVSLALPVACESQVAGDSPQSVRRRMNEAMQRGHVLKEMVDSLFVILDAAPSDAQVLDLDRLSLWSGTDEVEVPAGVNYADDRVD